MRPPHTDQPTILFVEDTQFAQETYTRMVVAILDTNSCRVLAVGSAEEALALQLPSTPILAVVDVSLPGMDGLTLAAQLRQLYPFMAIALMGMQHRVTQELDQELHIDAYLPKPFLIEELAPVLFSVLRAPRRSVSVQ